jgi:hypothetical protein
MPGGMISISADGNKAGTGILWALVPRFGDANQQRSVRAQLLAFDAQIIGTDIWRSEPLDASFGPNSVGLFAKFVPPTVANGKDFWRAHPAESCAGAWPSPRRTTCWLRG